MLQDVRIVNPPCSSQSLGRFLFKHRSVELPATSLSEGPEKTFDDRYGNSSPRHMRENHYAVLVIFENFSGFHSQEFSITLLSFLIYVSERATAQFRLQN